MSNKEYLTVSEVATIVEITTQAVYKQLHNQLQPFVVKVGNKTMLKKSVITEFYNKELPTNTTKVTNQSYQPICQLKPTQANSLVEVLNEQLNSKDQQIKDLLLKQDNLQVELYKQNEHNRQQADKLIALIEQVNELQKNNQILLAQNNKKQLENKVAEVPGEQIKEKTNFFKKVFNK